MGLHPTGSGKERAKKGGLKFETIHTHKTRYRGGNSQDPPTPKKYPVRFGSTPNSRFTAENIEDAVVSIQISALDIGKQK